MGRLTTHVLDMMAGRPATGLDLELFVLTGEPRLLRRATTNADGRVDGALLEGKDVTPGTYELRFHAGAYMRRAGVDLPELPFLDVIPIRFGIADADGHYHVPLLLSPYGYSTYRGS
jgi:5-hydroxyisourate hydrolase